MAGDATLHLALAEVLLYPDGEAHDALLARARLALSAGAPSMAASVALLARHLRDEGLEALQELYTQTFDMNPAATLDVGWHLFGESYKRGAFLVGLRQDMREHGLEEGTELPDHLPQVLRLLARLPDGDHADLLHRACVAPALLQVLRTLRGREANPYVAILEAASEHYGPPEHSSPTSLPVLHDGGREEAFHG